MASWPTLVDLRAFLRLAVDSGEDRVLEQARAAAIDYGVRRLDHRYPEGADDLPEGARQACLMDAARLYRRRDSIDGTIGWGDMGIVRVGRGDPDVNRLYDACGPWAFG